MSDTLIPQPHLDDEHRLSFSMGMSEVSQGHMAPGFFEAEFIPRQESSFYHFGHFETELKQDVAQHP